jgi:hypothetical protein
VIILFEKIKYNVQRVLFERNNKKTNSEVFGIIYAKNLWKENIGGV